MVDQFFTKPETVSRCLSILNLSKYRTIIEPAAGTGRFLDQLPRRARGVEIDAGIAPSGVFIGDFLKYWPTCSRSTLVVGNPPFSLAVGFFNHAAMFADAIAFIVPATFRRHSVQNRLNLAFHCKRILEIPKGSFDPETMQARCVFQVWRRQTKPREKFVATPSKDFRLCAPGEADIALKAYGGSGDCGTIIEPRCVTNPKAYHFLKLRNSRVKARLSQLDYYPLASWSVRQDTIGMLDLYTLYNEKFS